MPDYSPFSRRCYIIFLPNKHHGVVALYIIFLPKKHRTRTRECVSAKQTGLASLVFLRPCSHSFWLRHSQEFPRAAEEAKRKNESVRQKSLRRDEKTNVLVNNVCGRNRRGVVWMKTLKQKTKREPFVYQKVLSCLSRDANMQLA